MSAVQIVGVIIVIVVLIVGLGSPAYFEWRIGKLIDEYEKEEGET